MGTSLTCIWTDDFPAFAMNDGYRTSSSCRVTDIFHFFLFTLYLYGNFSIFPCHFLPPICLWIATCDDEQLCTSDDEQLFEEYDVS